ncbi:MAG TPA: tetratricopeptide repeat protein, partial [Casimicrobiaceae bacterium]|nr:tetratricopeptide repeat protein [Casimicrobiaceae bacterium]
MLLKSRKSQRPALGREEHEELIARTRSATAAGRYARSLAEVGRALARAPADAQLLFARAATLFAWRRCREARSACAEAQSSVIESLDLHLLVGWCAFGLGGLDDAEAAMRRAVQTAPEDARSHSNLAVVLQALKRHEEAVAGFERALALGGDDFDLRIGLGNARLALKDFAAAEEQFRRALARDDRRAVAWSLLGAAMGRQCRYEEALEAFEHADKLARDNEEDSTTFTNFAIALSENRRNREALDVFERYLPRFPLVEAHYAYSLALLRGGRLIEGWGQYEFRWLQSDAPTHVRLAGPVWSGQDLRGKTLLLHVEQGFGDVIQFVRYAPQVKALGAKVLLRVARPMKALLRGIAGVDRLLDRDEAIPDYDFYINLLSLPRILGTSLETIPGDFPYIRAEPERVARRAAKLPRDGRQRVGLVWAGNTQHPNDRFRSMDLGQLSAVLKVSGVRFVSLQKGAGSEQATEALLSGVDWVDIGSELQDFADTAAVIEELDLVLCVDTAVAHLAGAMGKAVWVMVAQPADFRWLEEREDSPWYPTLRLFRQSRRDDW